MDNQGMNYEILGRFWRDQTFPDKTLKAMIWHPIFKSGKNRTLKVSNKVFQNSYPSTWYFLALRDF